MTLAFTLFLVSFFVFLGMGIPIAFCLGLASTVYLTLSDAANLTIIFGRMQGVLQSYLYTAIPFFILASALMNTAGITNRIFDFANALVGHVRGGLAQVNVLASVIFSGMTGTVIGDAAGLGRIEIHAMREAGYRPAFAGAVTISSAVIGPIIPPSMIMIIYAELAEVSIVDLFLGGVIPGLLIGTILMIYIYFAAHRVGPKPAAPYSWPARGQAFSRAFLPALSPVIVVGGIVSGVITPTEAGLMAVLYALLLAGLYRSMSLGEMARAFREAALATAMPMVIISTAILFSWIITVEQVPNFLVGVLGGIVDNWVLTVLFINVVLLMMGMIMEGIGALILMIPIIKPIAVAAGIDLVHLGVFMIVNLMIGMITPPVGISLFVAAEITKCKLTEIIREVLPFLIPLVVSLLVISFIPETVTWLPDLVRR
jgi:tripartite ATP-independent transporter DctM subunit